MALSQDELDFLDSKPGTPAKPAPTTATPAAATPALSPAEETFLATPPKPRFPAPPPGPPRGPEGGAAGRAARTPPPPSGPPPSLEGLRSAIQEGTAGALDWFQRNKPTMPAPVAGDVGAPELGPVGTGILEAGRQAAMTGTAVLGGVGTTLANMLMGIAKQSPQLDPQGRLVTPGVLVRPGGGIVPTEELTSAAQLGASPLRFGGANALMRTPDLRPTFGTGPTVSMDELRAAMARADAGEARPPWRVIAQHLQPPGMGVPPEGGVPPEVPREPAELGGRPLSAEAQAAMQPAAPRSVGAMGTPYINSSISPEEAQAYRSVAEGQKLIEQQEPGIADTRELIPGVTVSAAQREQTVNAAREMKGLKLTNDEAAQADKDVAFQNNTLRTRYLDTAIGDEGLAYRLTKAQQAAIEEAKGRVFSADNVTGPFNPDNAVARIRSIMAVPENRQNPALQSALRDVIDRLVDQDGNARITNPREAWGLVQDIGRQTSKRMQADDANAHFVAHDLNNVANIISQSIEDVAPGYREMRAQYADYARQIEAIDVLGDARAGLFDSQGRMSFAAVQRLMKKIVDMRSTPANDLNAYKSISQDTMDALWNLRDDLRRVASAEDLARAPGSDTVPNLVSYFLNVGRFGGRAAAEMAASTMFPTVGPLIIRGLRSLWDPLAQQRMQARQAARFQQLLAPSNALSQQPQPPTMVEQQNRLLNPGGAP